MTLGFESLESPAMDYNVTYQDNVYNHTSYSEFTDVIAEFKPESIDKCDVHDVHETLPCKTLDNDANNQSKRIDNDAINQSKPITKSAKKPKKKNWRKNKRAVSIERSNQFKKQVKNTLILIGDSHVRYLSNFIKGLDANIPIIEHFQGGASLLQICNYLRDQVSSSDHVFVFGGTNDVNRNSLSKLKPSMLKLMSKCTLGKFTFILVPLRVHWNKDYHQNTDIVNFNMDLQKFLQEQNRCVNILDTNQILHAGHYSRDGIHLNDAGKLAISLAIVNIFLQGIK